MKIASVTFNPLTKNVGGGQIPAIAFKEWCDIFGIDCDVVGVLDQVTIGDKISPDVNIILESTHFLMLNYYDAIFFSTPIINSSANIEDIRKPFVVMIHGENDSKLYGQNTIDDMFNNPSFIDTVHIDVDKYFKEPSTLYWHTCCSPKDLIQKPIKPKYGNGILYAARITRWLNPELFIYITSNLITTDNHMYGHCLEQNLEDKIVSEGSNIRQRLKPFKRGEQYNNKTSLFWDVAGYYGRPFNMKRLSLSAYEGLKKGRIPIVGKGNAPKLFDGLVLEIDQYNFDLKKFMSDYDFFIENNCVILSKISERLITSHLGYNGVKYQVKRILNKLGVDV